MEIEPIRLYRRSINYRVKERKSYPKPIGKLLPDNSLANENQTAQKPPRKNAASPEVTDWALFRKKLVVLIEHNEKDGTTNFPKSTKIDPEILWQMGKYHKGYVQVVLKLMDEGELPNFVRAEEYLKPPEKIGKESLKPWENLVAELMPIINELNHFPSGTELRIREKKYVSYAMKDYHHGPTAVKDRMLKEGILVISPEGKVFPAPLNLQMPKR